MGGSAEFLEGGGCKEFDDLFLIKQKLQSWRSKLVQENTALRIRENYTRNKSALSLERSNN